MRTRQYSIYRYDNGRDTGFVAVLPSEAIKYLSKINHILSIAFRTYAEHGNLILNVGAIRESPLQI